MLNHIQQGGSQANAVGASSRGVKQARVMASSHVTRQGEKRGAPVSRADELKCATSQIRGRISGQQLTNEIRQKLIIPSSSQQFQSSRPQHPN